MPFRGFLNANYDLFRGPQSGDSGIHRDAFYVVLDGPGCGSGLFFKAVNRKLHVAMLGFAVMMTLDAALG